MAFVLCCFPLYNGACPLVPTKEKKKTKAKNDDEQIWEYKFY
jgi:hypothetical protein